MANITRYSPFEDFFRDFGKGYFVRPFALPPEADLGIKIDVKEDDKAFTVKADIPGVKKEDIRIDVEGDQVSVRAYGMVSRSFTLPRDVDAKAANAEYKDGVLTLTLPKKSNGSAKRIAIS